MPGRYRFPRPSRRLRLTRLEPRERQQKLESHDLPVNRGPVAPEAVISKVRNQPSSSALMPVWAYMPILAIVPPCAGECRLVRVTRVLIFAD
jgi:hypothetical protein